MKNNLVPEIRFFGFCGVWEERKFEEIVYRVSKQSNSAELPKIEFEDIISGMGRLKKDKFEKFDKRKGTEFEPNFILFGKLRPYLKNWLFSDFKGVALGDFWVFKAKNSCPIFVYYLIQGENYQAVANLSSGTKMPRSDWKTVSSTSFKIPCNITEQTKIGNFFKQLDDKINLNQRELELLKQTKQGFLQKMFPKEGESVPEIRFDGFSGDWEERKLGDITKSYSGGTPSVGKTNYYNGDIPFIRSGEINAVNTKLFISEEGINNSSAKMVKTGDILYALYGATSGEVGISKLTGAINQAILAIFPETGYNSEYISQQLRKEKSNITDTYLQGGQGNLSGAIVKELVLKFPTHQEQKKIGNFFKTLDQIILLQESKLQNLKQTKKAFLQKMLI